MGSTVWSWSWHFNVSRSTGQKIKYLLKFLRSWWWDSWVDPNNLYHIFKPFSVFVSRLPLADYTWNVTDPQVSSTPPNKIGAWGMAGVGQRGEQLVVSWIQDDCFTWANQNSGVKCASHSGLTLTISCSKTSSGIYHAITVYLLVFSVYGSQDV